jgi:hypothetical protein
MVLAVRKHRNLLTLSVTLGLCIPITGCPSLSMLHLKVKLVEAITPNIRCFTAVSTNSGVLASTYGIAIAFSP